MTKRVKNLQKQIQSLERDKKLVEAKCSEQQKRTTTLIKSISELNKRVDLLKKENFSLDDQVNALKKNSSEGGISVDRNKISRYQYEKIEQDAVRLKL